MFWQKRLKFSKDVLPNQTKNVDKKIDSEEHVDARNWLRNDSAKQVDVISDSKKLVVDESDPTRYPSVVTNTTN